MFVRFCADLRVESGERMELEPFQRKILADFFAGTTETVALVAKKNGKSTLIAAAALYCLCSIPDLECAVAATTRDQAAITLGQCRGFIRRSEGLSSRLKGQPARDHALRPRGSRPRDRSGHGFNRWLARRSRSRRRAAPSSIDRPLRHLA